MRGEQLAQARADWRAVPDARMCDLGATDVVVIVKSIGTASLEALKRWGGPIAYDALDFWDQPKKFWLPRSVAQRICDLESALALFRDHVRRIDPDIVLCPTRAMCDDVALLGWRTAVHYHHFDPRLNDAPATGGNRRVLLYSGHPAYLGKWRLYAWLTSATSGARFVSSRRIPPPPADAILAVRGGRHGCWLARRWKSSVKGATAMRLGLPLVAWPEAGLVETVSGGYWFDSVPGLRDALNRALAAPRPLPERELYSVGWSARELEQALEAALSHGRNV